MASKYFVVDVIGQAKRITVQEIVKDHIVEIKKRVEYDKLIDLFSNPIPMVISFELNLFFD